MIQISKFHFESESIPHKGIKLIRPTTPLSMDASGDPYDYEVFRGEMPCLGVGFDVTLSANEKVTGVNPYLLKSMGFFIACELREVECLRSLLLVTCNSFAFSHLSFTGNTMQTNTRRSYGYIN